jgi:tetratricopeptide (TPR) repeat protein
MALCCLMTAANAGAERVSFADARAAALGLSPALDLGLYSLESNPAALAALSSLQFTFTHKIFPAPDTASEVVGGAVPLGAYGTAAGGFGTVRVGGVERYSPDGRYLGGFVYHDDRLAGGYGVAVTPWLALGGAANYERHLTEPGAVYQSFGADAGFYVRPFAASPSTEYSTGNLALGLSARNLVATQRDVFTGRYREPLAVNAGASWARDVGRHRLGLTFSLPFSEPSRVAVGCEFVAASIFSLRAGATGTQPAAGVGVSTDLLSFGYTYAAREFGASHYLSVSVNPGRDIRGRDKRRRQIETWLAEGRGYFETGNYELAAKRFAEVLEWDPHNVAARQYWARAKYHQYMAEGVVSIKQKDWESARQAYRNALTVVPQDFLATESLTRVDELEAEAAARETEDARIEEELARAQGYRDRGAYRNAVAVYREILQKHPDHERTRELLAETQRLLAATTKVPEITPPTSTEIPEETIEKYREASALLNRGGMAEAARELAEIVADYPNYEAARAKLVEAYLYQGLDFYSKGSLSAAIRTWRRGLEFEPDNEKLKRYIKKAETEIDQIR